jgi:maltose alpha-D-glucosyltransferase/alpha-amylase
VELLGRRTAEMHVALADDRGDPAFAPEPYTALYLRSLMQSMRNTVRRCVQAVQHALPRLPEKLRAEAEDIIKREKEAIALLQRIGSVSQPALRIRCHGDFHLGQVLWTGKDFVIIDFEGEPLRSLGERRLKRTPLRDVAGMLRSFQYAAATGLRQSPGGGDNADAPARELARGWEAIIGGIYLRSYITAMREITPRLIPDGPALPIVLRTWLLEKALYEVRYELNSRPDWVDIPLRAVRELLDGII